MSIKKYTNGQVEQEFDLNGKLISQKFIADAEVEFSEENDINDSLYHPFDMNQPISIKILANILSKEKSIDLLKRFTFSDYYNNHCCIQESSLPEEDAIWLGTSRGSLMHLTRSMMEDLLPLLKHFVKYGYLPHTKD